MNHLVAKALLSLSTLLFISAASATAADAPPSDESLRTLFEVSKVKSLLDNISGQMNGMMKSTMDQAIAGQPSTPKQDQAIANYQERMAAIMREELSWTKLEPMYLKVYRNTFTQSEIDGMIVFYQTPAGEAMINKMPQVMQQTMTEMQGQMGPIMEKMQRLQSQLMHEVQGPDDDYER